ncbi:MAG TPA: class I SAM-dependent methyltransferase [Burkholderiales bacterium]|nr:class I SAM-dependent methyltransferase [Burkholderiales bacterium]
MNFSLYSGLPKIPDYQRLLQSELFKSMEGFSGGFLQSQSEHLKAYRGKWVADPLHQWSRQWEYPFVFAKIAEYQQNAGPQSELRILDAGSGVTFFPYYLASCFNHSLVSCCDYDYSLGNAYSRLNGCLPGRVQFVPGDLRSLPFQNKVFDIVYCVSVLEHTDAYSTIISEFRRVLKQGGMLVVTFDISVDGEADIPPEKAEELLEILYQHFPHSKKVAYANLKGKVHEQDLVTTHFIRKMNPSLLPWKYPLLTAMKSIAKLRLPRTLYRNLTFYCQSFD